ncbi:molybdate ABC transporter substrate-binding protein [Microbacterium suwonense]|uniref:Molybdate-binding protein n=1 Tax=Microbacterium suwonense TaxID=683047 RepID=A0ABN6WY19_9MICO|nr:molybdate ABC transporter substrate-binding protein [Microbacterium suwonense]BDZ37453.1 molybdate-binding protein [Microbacterium suwonense]
MRRTMTIAAGGAALALLLSGCSGAPQDAAPSPAHTDTLSGDLAISAAASLKGAFDEAIEQFSSQHPAVTVTATYDGSSTLATQINGGARVDVFASADEANMTKVTSPGLAVDPVLFAHNTLVVVVPKGNPAGIETLADLADPDAKVVLCAPEVPCGGASQRLLDGQGVKLTPVSQEQNVTAVLTKVRSDEADAGLVYKTDAATTDEVESFTPDGADQVVNSYPIVVLEDAPNPDAAQAFVDFITGTAGQQILAMFGFDGP